ncbi:type II toxin-antitoxin system prevent-host-death family antitoxin [Devosia sp. ZB163]|uniref:type II toxin-antitoxin system Phd/YefM family antitoxin n=1 Tax=Devosia sp. ZB163 TaxID=3025938 RepID=UPI00235F6407|nr:type II toxin-antitoxin system prevent-host-death family antitoxin [Devosia sp. ZB163]MDC9825005.1 type II toxin-antitoxin system prevent-host-death family antitoxin [Devosia sp. ZB163]
MRATTATDFRKNLASELDRVENDREPLIIVRSGGKPAAILMSLEEFGSWEATQHLLKSPENARQLRESIAEYEAGKLIEVPWPE